MEGENIVSSTLQSDSELDEISLIEAEINHAKEAEATEGGVNGATASISENTTRSKEEIRQYVVYVQNDGSLRLDKSGILPEDADPACVFPVRLPVAKLQDPENPLPGAIMLEPVHQRQQQEESLAASPSLVYDSETNQVIGGSVDVDKIEQQMVGKLVEMEIGKKNKKAGGKGTSPSQPTPQPSSSLLASTRRVSQRQQDRSERLEAEKIMAENQQMLMKEKEEMKPKLPQHTVTPSGFTVQVKKKEEEPTANENEQSKRNPRRSRKLPAALSDPNYINPLEDSGKHHIEEEEKDKAEGENDEEQEENEDDPNKLWCICRKPHNNRFMINCDGCDDWFHGKCVGVTKAQGQVIEQMKMEWHCPTCKKAREEEKRLAKLKERGHQRLSGPLGRTHRDKSRLLEEKPKSSPVSFLKGKISTTPVKPEVRKSDDKLKQAQPADYPTREHTRDRKSSDASIRQSTEANEKLLRENMKRSIQAPEVRKSDDKLKQALPNDQSKNKPSTAKDEKLRDSRQFEPVRKDKNIFESPKRDRKSLESSNREQTRDKKSSDASMRQSSEDNEKLLRENVNRSIQAPEVRKSDDKLKQAQDQTKIKPSTVKDEQLQDRKQSDKKIFEFPKLERKSSESSNREQTRDRKSLDASMRQSSGDNEKLLRENLKRSIQAPEVRKSDDKLKQALDQSKNKPSTAKDEKLRDRRQSEPVPKDKKIFEAPKLERKSSESSNREKTRDRKSSDASMRQSSGDNEKLLRENMKRSIQALLEEKAKSISDVKISPETIAKDIEKELVKTFGSAGNPKCKNKYRSLLLNMKNQRSSLPSDLLTSNLQPKQLVQMDSTQLAPAELTEWRLRESQKELEAIKRSELEKLTEAKKLELMEAGREVDDVEKVARAGLDLVGVGTAEEEEHHKKKGKTENEEKRVKKKNREKVAPLQTKELMITDKPESEDPEEMEKETMTPPPTLYTPSASYAPSTSYTPPQPLESELPSSTMKTPDFNREEKTTEPLFKTKLVMPELGTLHTSVFNVSHQHVEGVLFPESPVPIVGRISPETVWDYIDKMKKSKELIILRLAPLTTADTEAYMTFFSYLASRGRLGVLGGISAPLKDVYLVPLDKYSPVNRCLLPFHGPGLPTERSHCLLAVVTRQLETRTILRGIKKPRLEIKPGLLTSILEAAKREDDKPYEPEWEEDGESPPSPPPSKPQKPSAVAPSAPPKSLIKTELEKLNEQIARERQEIEFISVAISRNSDLAKTGGIPGLDGEFDESFDETPSKPIKASSSSLFQPIISSFPKKSVNLEEKVESDSPEIISPENEEASVVLEEEKPGNAVDAEVTLVS